MTHILCLALLLAALALPADAGPIDALEAGGHVGQDVIVQGTVTKVVFQTDGSVLLHFGAPEAEPYFSAILLMPDQFPDLAGLKGRKVSVSGTILGGARHPEMVILSPHALTTD